MDDFFSETELELHIKARKVFLISENLKNINDEDNISLWKGFIPKSDVINKFWPIFAPLFDQEHLKYKDIKAEVIYFGAGGVYSSEVLDISKIVSTGLYVSYITSAEAYQIDQETQKAKEQFLSPSVGGITKTK